MDIEVNGRRGCGLGWGLSASGGGEEQGRKQNQGADKLHGDFFR
jgi:hypothetical protein